MIPLDEAVHVTQEQLRNALRSLLGDKAQVTVREDLRQWYRLLPSPHYRIDRNEWISAAAAEGLEYEGESPWGFTVWRKGAAKQPVAKKKYVRGMGLCPVSEYPWQAFMPEKSPHAIAAKARLLVDEAQKVGRTLSYAAAVSQVMGRQ